MCKDKQFRFGLGLGAALAFVGAVVGIVLAFSASPVRSETVYFKADDNGPITRIEAPSGSVEVLPSSGNAHAVNHPKMAIENGYEFCVGCHREGGTAIVNTIDKFL